MKKKKPLRLNICFIVWKQYLGEGRGHVGKNNNIFIYSSNTGVSRIIIENVRDTTICSCFFFRFRYSITQVKKPKKKKNDFKRNIKKTNNK